MTLGTLAFKPLSCCGRAEDGQTDCVQPGQTVPSETARGDPGQSGRATTKMIPTCDDMTIFLKTTRINYHWVLSNIQTRLQCSELAETEQTERHFYNVAGQYTNVFYNLTRCMYKMFLDWLRT